MIILISLEVNIMLSKAILFLVQLILILNVINAFTIRRKYDQKPRLALKASTESNLQNMEPVPLNYMCLQSPESSNPPVILLHGLLGQKRNLATLGALLYNQLEKKRTIYAVDLRNHGDNHRNEWKDEMSYSHMATDIFAFMEEHEIENAILCGHSLGGKVTMSCALSQPHRVCGAIVLDISPVRYTLKDCAWRNVQDIVNALTSVEITKFSSKKELDLELLDSVPDDELRAFILTSVEEANVDGTPRLQWKLNIEAISNQMDVMAGFDVLDDNLNLRCEEGIDDFMYQGNLLLVNSPKSKYVKSSHLSTIQRHFPNFMITSVKDSGHSIHHENADELASILKQYLDNI